MAKGKNQKDKTIETTHYQHDDAKRKNIPSAVMEAEGKVPTVKRVKYAYSPHLDPILRFDPTGRADVVQSIVDKACRGERLSAAEQEILRAVGHNWEQPWLEWAGKQEEHARGHFSVDPVALHIHERISAQAILRNAMREDTQRSLFGDPEQTYADALQFYKHDIDWANRLILGDSLQVMSSLAHRENLAGKVQMIYLDPPYGIRFASNFQPEVGNREVKDGRDSDLTREAEMVRAFRDTWHLGVSSYLSYLRERFAVARELLSNSGSIFVQISDDNLHWVRNLLDSVFGSDQFCSLISVWKTSSATSSLVASTCDYLLWYAKDRDLVKYRPQYLEKSPSDPDSGAAEYKFIELATGERRPARAAEVTSADARLYRPSPTTSQSGSDASRQPIEVAGRRYSPGPGGWKTNPAGFQRLEGANRLLTRNRSVSYVRFLADFPVVPVSNLWTDTRWGFDASEKRYVVETNPSVIRRCVLMTTDPGDLIVDPTCGSGTSAFVAEQLGRRWITIDTSRVSIAIARQRLLTGRFEHYVTNAGPEPGSPSENPRSGFKLKKVPHVTLKAIAQNSTLDPLFRRHDEILDARLSELNATLRPHLVTLHGQMMAKMATKESRQGKRAITDADRRRWVLPPNHRNLDEDWVKDPGFKGWYHWEVPFDTDPDWPADLIEALEQYRSAWKNKMDDIEACISANSESELLVDQPLVAKNVVRVSGPFTVEGVIPEELSLGEDGLFDATPNEFESDGPGVAGDRQNLSAYLSRMVSHLRSDGLTFLNNQHKKIETLTPLFEEGSASSIHAEGNWDGEPDSAVGVTFGPQYGPVTALQVEDAIRSAKRYTDLVIAGFSFDAETYAIVEAQQHPKLRIHIAQIRPDLNESMDGLLKNTPNSQLFTVFGQPDIEVKETKDGWVCKLDGVVIYDPTENTLRSAHADKVAAWFLDSDYDGRCFCATQAFFPNKDAWEKIAKALGSQADADAFEAFNGTRSLPFQAGQYKRIAVKVIDPRGNEVMAIRKLK